MNEMVEKVLDEWREIAVRAIDVWEEQLELRRAELEHAQLVETRLSSQVKDRVELQAAREQRLKESQEARYGVLAAREARLASRKHR